MFDDFPYSNKAELNLDWILSKIKELETRVEALENKEVAKNGDVR